MRPVIPSLAVCLILAGCVTAQAPAKTLAQLDPNDPQYPSARCAEARATASDYNDHPMVRTAMGVGGNVVAPFAGTAASVVVSRKLDKKRDKLNRRVAAACVSDPLAEAAGPAR